MTMVLLGTPSIQKWMGGGGGGSDFLKGMGKPGLAPERSGAGRSLQPRKPAARPRGLTPGPPALLCSHPPATPLSLARETRLQLRRQVRNLRRTLSSWTEELIL